MGGGNPVSVITDPIVDAISPVTDPIADAISPVTEPIYDAVIAPVVAPVVAIVAPPPAPEPCEGTWSDYGACSASCDGGTQTRTWTTTKNPKHGGTACPSPTTQSQACNTQSCPVNCEGGWSDYGACDVTCGGGTQTRTWTTTTPAAHGGTACPPTMELRECNTQACGPSPGPSPDSDDNNNNLYIAFASILSVCCCILIMIMLLSAGGTPPPRGRFRR